MAPKTKRAKATSPKGTRKTKTFQQRQQEAVTTNTYIHVRQAKNKNGQLEFDSAGNPKIKYSECQLTGYEKFWIQPKPRSPRLGAAKRPSLYNPNFIYVPSYRVAGDKSLLERVIPSMIGQPVYDMRCLTPNVNPAFDAELENLQKIKKLQGPAKKNTISLEEIINVGRHVSTVTEQKKSPRSPKKTSPRIAGGQNVPDQFLDMLKKLREGNDFLDVSGLKANGTGSRLKTKIPEKHVKLTDRIFYGTGGTKNVEHEEAGKIARKFLQALGGERVSPRASPRMEALGAAPLGAAPLGFAPLGAAPFAPLGGMGAAALPLPRQSPRPLPGRTSPSKFPGGMLPLNGVNIPSLPAFGAPPSIAGIGGGQPVAQFGQQLGGAGPFGQAVTVKPF